VYEAGTSRVEGTVWVSGSGARGSSGGLGSVSGTSQTALARRAAPPKKAKGVVVLFLLVFLLGLVGMAAVLAAFWEMGKPLEMPEGLTPLHTKLLAWCSEQSVIRDNPGAEKFVEKLGGEWRSWTLGLYVAIAASLLSIPLGIRNTVWNFTTHRKLMQEWEKKWYCSRCANFFQE
jgi:hypothetical protein